MTKTLFRPEYIGVSDIGIYHLNQFQLERNDNSQTKESILYIPNPQTVKLKLKDTKAQNLKCTGI